MLRIASGTAVATGEDFALIQKTLYKRLAGPVYGLGQCGLRHQFDVYTVLKVIVYSFEKVHQKVISSEINHYIGRLAGIIYA